jgi:hypothetical protein
LKAWKGIPRSLRRIQGLLISELLRPDRQTTAGKRLIDLLALQVPEQTRGLQSLTLSRQSRLISLTEHLRSKTRSLESPLLICIILSCNDPPCNICDILPCLPIRLCSRTATKSP